MEAAAALALAKECAAAGMVRFVGHALQRMNERGATARDVIHALETATRARPSDKPGRWRLQGGEDLDGEDLTVVVAFDGEVVVITLF